MKTDLKGLVRAGIGLAGVAALAWFAACSDNPVDPCPTCPPPPQGVIMSNPVPVAALGAEVRGELAQAPGAGTDVVYVSLAPGTVPTGSRAILRRVGDAASLATAVNDGGFDPVPVTAQAGDSIDVTVTDAGGSTVYHVRAAVLAARPPVIVRTEPPPRKRDVPLNASIVIVFSEPVNGSTLNSSSVRLLRGTTSIAGTVRLLKERAAAVFTPAASLEPNADYALIVTEAVRDLEGDALAAAFSVEFRTGTALVGPVASVSVGPDSLEVAVGSQAQLTATAHDAQGNVVTGRPVQWSSSDPSVATVSATGLVTGLATGSTEILAEVDGQTGGMRIYVSAMLVPIGSVTVMPESARVAVGGTLQLMADIRDTTGAIVQLSRPITWTSSDSTVATVAPNSSRGAIVTGVGAGIAKISALVEGKSDTSVAAVGPPGSIVGLVLSPDSATVVLLAALQLSAFGRDDQGFLNPIDSTQVSWASSNSSVASATSTGLVTGLQAGSATITGTWSGHQATVSVTVVSISFTAISAGGSHTCGVTLNGAAFCWGSGGEGELGIGTSAAYGHAMPAAVAGGHVFTAVSVTWGYSCGLADGGTAYCWGSGHGGTEVCLNGLCSTTPVAVAGVPRFSVLGVGGWYDCGLTVGGSAYCWWWDGRSSPVAVGEGLTFVALTVGGSHACALTAGGVAYCWGGNFYGQLGTGDTVSSSLTPRAVAGGLRFSALSAGEQHTCALTSSGAVYCWGRSSSTGGDYSWTPTPVMSGVTFVAIDGKGGATCGLVSNGTIHCWDNPAGAPWTVTGGFVFTTLSVGTGHSCALTAARVGYCWGYNWAGQLGNGTTTDSSVPVKVAGQP